ncbi:MAG TPA: hypothetical protein VMA83_08280 [Solirubrobacteraceae bacterium]|nr:hypothetical protein [Solirubrobacteraceae bacterium]
MELPRFIHAAAWVAVAALDLALLAWGVSRASILIVGVWAVLTPLAVFALRAADAAVWRREQ